MTAEKLGSLRNKKMGESDIQDRTYIKERDYPIGHNLSQTKSRRINITKNSRRLETISKGDILIFPDREEIVMEVDIQIGHLYTERKKAMKDNSKYSQILEKICYDGIERVHPQSNGHVYDYIKFKRLENIEYVR